MTSTQTALDDLAPLARTLHQLDEAHRRFRAHVAAIHELSPGELSALVLIADAPGVGPKVLGADLHLSTGAITALLDRLEDAGLTRRENHPDDRRRLQIQLTSAGEATMVQLQHAYRTALRRSNTETAVAHTLTALARITASLNAAAGEGTAPPTVPGE